MQDREVEYQASIYLRVVRKFWRGGFSSAWPEGVLPQYLWVPLTTDEWQLTFRQYLYLRDRLKLSCWSVISPVLAHYTGLKERRVHVA